MINRAYKRRQALLLVPLLLVACERADWDPTVRVSSPKGHVVDTERYQERLKRKEQGPDTYAAEITGIGQGGKQGPAPPQTMQTGTGEFVKPVPREEITPEAGDVTLNFDSTDIREVVKVVLGDLLGANYVLDPGVLGVATLQTGRPLKREHLLPALETLLRMNQAAILVRDGTYYVVPISNAIQGKVVPQLGDSNRALPEGYTVRVVPLKYIGADEMSTILKPLVPEGSILRVDNLRNLLVIAGTSPEVSNLLDTIEVFDVDWMKGLSVGFFTLDFAKAGDVVSKLEALLSDEGASPLKGLFRFVPMESANSVLVISPQARYLAEARKWIERLDQAEASSGEASQRLFVYRVRHGDAENLAGILTEIFAESKSATGTRRAAGGVAPGLRSAEIQSGEQQSGEPTGGGTAARRVSGTISLSSEVSIVADTVNNSLLIKASPRDYRIILDALRQLDITPLQVLVEATIIEVQLTGTLQYGLRWTFTQGLNGYTGETSLEGDSVGGGFNWTVSTPKGTVRAVLTALASSGQANVLSSPSVMVLDNQTARIQVGDSIPVPTSQQQSITSADAPIVNSIQYRDTGVILSVKPRVTPGGLVMMEIEQEVSQPGPVVRNAPSFATRNITSSVAVQSNQAVVLGGLIQDRLTNSKDGIPGLYNLPAIGWLFSGSRSKEATRTELVVVLTPQVIKSDKEIETVTEDFRNKLKGLEGSF